MANTSYSKFSLMLSYTGNKIHAIQDHIIQCNLLELHSTQQNTMQYLLHTQTQTVIYLNCANYWCDKLSYRFAIVCDLGGGGQKSVTKISRNNPKSYIFSFRFCFQLSYRIYGFINFAAFFIITNISYTLNKME